MLPDDGGRLARPFVHEPDGYAALAASLGLSADAFEDELATRAAFLDRLATDGICDPPSVAAAVNAFATGSDPA